MPYADDEQQRFDELSALYLTCRKRLYEINLETKVPSLPGSVARQDEASLLGHDPPVPDPARHLANRALLSLSHP